MGLDVSLPIRVTHKLADKCELEGVAISIKLELARQPYVVENWESPLTKRVNHA